MHVRIIIGITQDHARIQTLLATYRGRRETLTEMGPFISKEEASHWLSFLKSKINPIEEIFPEQTFDEDKLWFGFTFEQLMDK